MPVYESKSGLNLSSFSEEDMNKFIPRDFAIQAYCVGNGFGRVEGFENYYQKDLTYKMFFNRMVKAGLLVQKR